MIQAIGPVYNSPVRWRIKNTNGRIKEEHKYPDTILHNELSPPSTKKTHWNTIKKACKS